MKGIVPAKRPVKQGHHINFYKNYSINAFSPKVKKIDLKTGFLNLAENHDFELSCLIFNLQS